MPRLRDPEAHALERRAQILTEAIRVFGDKGYHAANIADIAKRLGLGHGTFYRYFQSKLDIFSAVVDGVLGALQELVIAESATTSDTLDDYRAQLGRIGGRLRAIFERHRSLARLVLQEGLSVDPVIAAKVRAAMELFAKFTEAYLENGRKKGFLRDDLDVEITARAINAMIFESLFHLAHDATLAQRWQDAIVRLMLDGMRAR